MPDEGFRKRLVRLYATHKVDDVGRLPEFKQLREEFAKDPFFDRERSRIERAKAAVEAHLEDPQNAPTQQRSIRNAIRVLAANRKTEETEVDLLSLLYDLITIGYRERWTQAQREYFDAAWNIIRLKYDFFLSFTSRQPDPPLRINPINVAYKHLINYILDEKSVTDQDRKETNLLAKAIYSRLQPRPGFYYPRLQYDNAETEEKLVDACDNSFVFVQLIQNIIFDPPPQGRNYCFFEWERVWNRSTPADRKNRMLFVLAERDHTGFENMLVSLPYEPWRNHVTRKDTPHLPEPGVWDEAVLDDLKRRITQHVVDKIDLAWRELADGVPN
jgi:hypothetical protein